MFRAGLQRASEAARAQAGLRVAPQLTSTVRAKSDYPTDFLGTPANHDELQKSRPMSPHLLTIDNQPHYKFPPIALSSITNRITGCMLSIGMGGVGYMSLKGDVVGTIEALKHVPLVLPMFKFSMAFPLVFHSLGGLRHIWWDNTCKNFTNEEMELSAKVLFGASAASSVALSFMSF